MALKYLYAPSGVQAGKAYGVMPNSADADFSSFSRSSAGSRVDENGFINTGLGLGSEEVVDGGFDNPSSWATTVATISNSRAIFIDGTGAYSNVRQGGVLAINKTYEVTIDVVINSGGGLKVQDGSGNTYKQITESGVYTFRFTSIGSSSSFYIVRNLGGVAYDMYVESVSVREITDVNTDVPRLNYPLIDGEVQGCPSLLLEPASTNYIQYSEDFSQSYWSKGNIISLSKESILNPEGSLGAYKVNANGTGSTFVRSYFSASAQAYTTSLFIKKGNHRYIGIRGLINASGNDHIVFDFDTESVIVPSNISSDPEYVSSGYEPYKNGWFRVYVTISVASAQGRYAGVCVSNSVGSENGTFSDAYFYVTDAQLEPLSYPSSYIPNYGTAAGVTRSADVAGSTGDLSSVINSTEGVLMAEISALANDLTYRGISLGDGTGSNLVRIYYENISNRFTAQINSGGVTQATMIHTFTDITNNSKIAVKYKQNDFALWVNGIEVETETIGNTPTGLNVLQFNTGTGGDTFYGKTKQIRYYDTALSDSELQELTTL